jgi:peroxiredoxin
MSLIRQIAATSLAGLFILSAEAAVKVGESAPAFSLPGEDGKMHALDDYRGKTVVLEWTNDGCPFVKKQYSSGNMQSLQKQYTAKDVVWLSIVSSAPGKQGAIDAAQAATLTTARQAAPTHVLLDPKGTVGRLYEAKTTPHLFVIDKTGQLAYDGAIDSIPSADPEDIPQATPYVKNALDEVLAGKPVTVATTKPYGCSIKY